MALIEMKAFRTIELANPKTGQLGPCYLVKYERRTYDTVRIGTLEYYRGIEGNQSDPMEGRVEGVIYEADESTDISREELLRLSGGSLNVHAKGGIVFGKGGSYADDKPRKCSNAYVYCCSYEHGLFPDKERLAHFQATEHFVIDDPDLFRKEIEAELFKYAKSKDGLPYCKEKHYIKSWAAPVRYLSRVNAKAELPLNILDFFVYQKDPKFQIELEFRFTWIFFDKKTNLPVEMSADPVDIRCNHEIGAAYIHKPL